MRYERTTLQFMFTCQANRDSTCSRFSFVCYGKTRHKTTYQIAFWCLALESQRAALSRPPCSSKQISEPDKSRVLFFPVTNPTSKRRAESLHQPLVMAMKWTAACIGATVAAPSQHTDVTPKNQRRQRRPVGPRYTANKTALSFIWFTYSCLLLEIQCCDNVTLQHCCKKMNIISHAETNFESYTVITVASASFKRSHWPIRRSKGMETSLIHIL